MKLSEARTTLNDVRNNYDGSAIALSPEKSAEFREALDAVIGTYSEPTFILKTRDRFSVSAVRNWIWQLRSIAGDEAGQKIKEATDVLNRMQLFHETQPEEVRNPE